MRITCPHCTNQVDIAVAINDADARRFAALMGTLPPAIGRLVPAYLGLFKPAKQSSLRWGRALSLLETMAQDIQQAQIRRNGRDWPAPLENWVDAVEQMLASRDAGKLKTPLKNHAYLYQILATKADATEAKAETATENSRQSNHGRPRKAGLAEVKGYLGGLRAAMQTRGEDGPG